MPDSARNAQDPTPYDDIVSRQYEAWPYPAPIEDVGVWCRNQWEWFDPSHAAGVLWPSHAPEGDLDILIAGCGTSQAAVFAYNNPGAHVLAIDVSHASLAHETRLKEKHGLWNLELRALAIEELPALERTFDLIVSTGVLHHMEDPATGLAALRACLRPEGVIGLMLYGSQGRTGIDSLRSAFRDAGLKQDSRSAETVRHILATLAADHPVRHYLRSAPDLQSVAGLIDTFLHGRAREYDVTQCLALVKRAGLAFQGWMLNTPYYPHDLSDTTDGLQALVAHLPKERAWSVVERIRANAARHLFMACLPERPASHHAIDFNGTDALRYIPGFRTRCGLTPQGISIPGGRIPLDPAHLPFAQAMDGTRTIRQIIDTATARSTADLQDLDSFALRLFDELWRLDAIQIGLPG